jgi:flagellar protein FlaF
MGAASLVATAVGLFLIGFSAYVLVGGTLTTAQTVSAGQKALSDREVEKVHTVIQINASSYVLGGNRRAFIVVKNTGSETISNISGMQVYLLKDSLPLYLSNISGQWTWTIQQDDINPKMLDPYEEMNITVPFTGNRPTWAKVVTPNGIYASRYL